MSADDGLPGENPRDEAWFRTSRSRVRCQQGAELRQHGRQCKALQDPQRAADRPFYSGKHHRRGMNLQVISAPDGEILWVSGPLPGAVHDLNAAQIWGIVRELATAGLIVLADKGYTGAGDHIRTPTRGRTNRPPRRLPTAPTPSCAAQANAPTPSSKPGISCANSDAARGRP